MPPTQIPTSPWKTLALSFAIAVLFHSASALHGNFDAYVQGASGVRHATAVAAKSAASNGFSLLPFSLAATVLAITWPSFSLPYYLGSAYFAGEVRAGKRTQLLAGPVTAAIAILIAAIGISRIHRRRVGIPVMAPSPDHSARIDRRRSSPACRARGRRFAARARGREVTAMFSPSGG